MNKLVVLLIGFSSSYLFNVLSNLKPWTFWISGSIECQAHQLGEWCRPVIYMLLLLEEVPILFLIASLTHFFSKIWKKPFEADYWPVVFVFGFMASEPLTSLVLYPEWYIGSFADLWGMRIFNFVSHSIVLYGALVFVKHITSQATGTALQAARS